MSRTDFGGVEREGEKQSADRVALFYPSHLLVKPSPALARRAARQHLLMQIVVGALGSERQHSPGPAAAQSASVLHGVKHVPVFRAICPAGHVGTGGLAMQNEYAIEM
jgi:hypothetical protein